MFPTAGHVTAFVSFQPRNNRVTNSRETESRQTNNQPNSNEAHGISEIRDASADREKREPISYGTRNNERTYLRALRDYCIEFVSFGVTPFPGRVSSSTAAHWSPVRVRYSFSGILTWQRGYETLGQGKDEIQQTIDPLRHKFKVHCNGTGVGQLLEMELESGFKVGI